MDKLLILSRVTFIPVVCGHGPMPLLVFPLSLPYYAFVFFFSLRVPRGGAHGLAPYSPPWPTILPRRVHKDLAAPGIPFLIIIESKILREQSLHGPDITAVHGRIER